MAQPPATREWFRAHIDQPSGSEAVVAYSTLAEKPAMPRRRRLGASVAEPDGLPPPRLSAASLRVDSGPCTGRAETREISVAQEPSQPSRARARCIAGDTPR